MKLKAQLLCVTTSLFLLCGPWWIPAKIGKYNAFLWSDAIVAIGVAMAGALLCLWFLPRQITAFFDRTAPKISSTIVWLTPVALLLVCYSLIQVNQQILQSFLNSADEHSCYFLAECLRKGKLFTEQHPLWEFFKTVHVGNRDGKWFSVYPLGWPLIWALGLQLKIVDWLNPFMVSISLFFFYLSGNRLFGKTASWLGLFLVCSTPYFLFTSASYFSHGTCLLTVSIFLYSFLSWRSASSEKKRIFWAALMAFACGYGLTTRYLTMAAMAGPFLIYHYWPLLRKQKRWGKDDTVVCMILGAFILLNLAHNFAVTGKPFKAPNKYDKSWERLGFRSDYTPIDGMMFFIMRLFYLSDWISGTLIVLYFAALWGKRRLSAIQNLVRFSFLFLAAGYFLYYSWGGNQWGPRYYYEGLPFFGLTIGHFITDAWKQRDEHFKKFLAGLVVLTLGVNGFLFIKQSAFYRQAVSQRKALYLLAEEKIQSPAIIFIRGNLGKQLILGEEDAVRNSPWLNGTILFAHDKGPENLRLAQFYPDRQTYRGYYDQDLEQPRLEPIEF